MKNILFCCLIAMPSLHADVVSWNFDLYGTVTGTNTAGIVPVSNWNNTFATGAGNNTIALPSNLVDNTGTATTLDITSIVRNGTWRVNYPTTAAPGVDLDGTYNRNLLNGYLNSGAGASNIISLAQIPYEKYDLYVYFSSDTANRAGSVTVGGTSYYFDTIGATSVSGSNALMVQTMETTDVVDNINANYAVFSGLSGDSQTITTTIPLYGGIAGFQVVRVSSGFSTWIDSFNPPLSDPNDRLPGADPDHDGITNLMEYALYQGDPTVSSPAILPSSATPGSNLVFTFYRRNGSTTDTTQSFQYGSDLSGWTDLAIPGGAGVTVTPDTPEAGIDKVEVTTDRTGNPMLFGRFKVVQP